MFRQVTWTAPSRDLLEAHASLVDEILREIYEISCRSADSEAPRSTNSSLSIVATGGYGRTELNPFSDIDIAFIPSEEDDPWVEALVHTAFKLVMDVFLSFREVHVGYSFRPIAEASSWDVSTKTALLDLRHICGDQALSDRLWHRMREILSPLDIMLEAQYPESGGKDLGKSLYSVEPNLKEGPGSLRDLHRARWMFKLFLDVRNRHLEAALQNRVGMTPQQIAQIREAKDWFLRARTWLHLKAGRPSDVLFVNYQDKIARELGDCSAQEWLSKHLAHAETLARFRVAAIQTLQQGPLPIHEVLLKDGFLHLPADFDDASVVRIFHLSQRYDIPVSISDLKLLAEARPKALEVQDPSKAEVRAFKQILNEFQNIARTMRALADFGFLDRFIPNYSDVMRFVPPDPAHRYSVGEHSIRIIELLEALRSGEDERGRRFMDLIDQCAHFDVLCLAALLHDAGKLLPGEHSESSAVLAKAVSSKLKLSQEKRELLDIIIRRHLLLVRITRLLDLKSRHVLERVAERVPNEDALRHLYVFTYVDTSAVAEHNWTSMDSRDLEELYRKMRQYYEESADRDPGDAKRKDKNILIRKKLTALQGMEKDEALLKHCDDMPSGYVLNTPLGEISFHLQLLGRLDSEKTVFDVYNRPGDDYSELTICTYDDPKPGMLAKITGVLYGCNVDIHRARAFTIKKERPVILDTLWTRSNGTQISESRARKIRTSLRDVLSGSKTVAQFLEQAGKTPPDTIALDSIRLRNDLSEEHTVVNIVAPDLQGLLYLISRGLSRCGVDIHSAKVATWRGLCENNFYVTSPTGSQIPDRDLPVWTDLIAHVLSGGGDESPNPTQ